MIFLLGRIFFIPILRLLVAIVLLEMFHQVLLVFFNLSHLDNAASHFPSLSCSACDNMTNSSQGVCTFLIRKYKGFSLREILEYSLSGRILKSKGITQSIIKSFLLGWLCTTVLYYHSAIVLLSDSNKASRKCSYSKHTSQCGYRFITNLWFSVTFPFSTLDEKILVLH